MDEQGSKGPRGEVFTKTIRAGKRTYFFDVKTTRSKEFYLTITESKKRFNQQSGKFYYEKHKVFLYPEDFEKFTDAMKEAFSFIETSNPEDYFDENEPGLEDVKFEDLDKKQPEKTEKPDSEKEGDSSEDKEKEEEEDAKNNDEKGEEEEKEE